ncbi:hypothetical protein HMPREF3173_14725 [Pseudomonas sp. HMSC08G10]|nr:hypothetical protein HMPREF3173_14725 [Pseudomonas sp. HMSC08G10]
MLDRHISYAKARRAGLLVGWIWASGIEGTLRIVFSHPTAIESVRAVLSHAAVIESVRTALSHTTSIESVRTTLSDTTSIESVRAVLGHAAVIESVRTTLSHKWSHHLFTGLITPNADFFGWQRHRTCADNRQGDSDHHFVNSFHDSDSVISNGFVAGCQCKA